ncbi:TPA: phage protein [Yersinia enterocolitica]
MSTYSFMDVTASITGVGGSFDLGYGAAVAEEGITTSMIENKNTMTIGADGEGMHSLHAGKGGTVTADAGYSPGDFAAGWSIHSSANAATVAFPALSSTTIQTNTGAAGTGLLVNGKGGGGSYSAVLANWRYILRIFY